MDPKTFITDIATPQAQNKHSYHDHPTTKIAMCPAAARRHNTAVQISGNLPSCAGTHRVAAPHKARNDRLTSDLTHDDIRVTLKLGVMPYAVQHLANDGKNILSEGVQTLGKIKLYKT